MKLIKGDEIKVIRGKDKGKTGKIDKVLAKEDMVLLLGLNQYKRHIKSQSQTQKSEIKTISKPFAVSNVMLVCPKCHIQTRIGYKILGDKKSRICRKCEQEI